MPVTAPPPLPLAIDRVERSRAKQDQVRLRLTGRWLSGAHESEAGTSEALLVVQMHGRRHRFAATRDDPQAEPSLEFTASFTIPDWAVPEQPGQAVLWVGDDVVAVPPPGAASRPPEPPAPGREDFVVASNVREAEPVLAERDREPSGAHPHASDAGAGRSGPLAELLFKETVTALRSELDQRTAEAAQLRARLAEVQREAESRSGAGSGLESAHAELRAELRHLMEAVGEQRREFDEQLSAAHGERDQAQDARDHAQGERDQAQGECDRAREELDRARAELDPVRGELEQVRSELADVRAELEGSRAELDQARGDRDAARGEVESRLATARAEFDQQLAAARAEGETTLAAAVSDAEVQTDAARQETETMLAAVRGESDTRAQTAEAEARELGARLRERTAGERRRAEEAAVLREQLAAAHVARDAAFGEVGRLRAELERLGGELAVAREQGGGAGDELSEAQQLLADARALTERLRGESSA
jgi:DNA repair exonuclease SbcCD ATPase subunit